MVVSLPAHLLWGAKNVALSAIEVRACTNTYTHPYLIFFHHRQLATLTRQVLQNEGADSFSQTTYTPPTNFFHHQMKIWNFWISKFSFAPYIQVHFQLCKTKVLRYCTVFLQTYTYTPPAYFFTITRPSFYSIGGEKIKRRCVCLFQSPYTQVCKVLDLASTGQLQEGEKKSRRGVCVEMRKIDKAVQVYERKEAT